MSIRLDDGAHYVGRVARCNPDLGRLVLKCWGREHATRFPTKRIVAARPLGPHTQAERRMVATRQARGEPALVLGEKS